MKNGERYAIIETVRDMPAKNTDELRIKVMSLLNAIFEEHELEIGELNRQVRLAEIALQQNEEQRRAEQNIILEAHQVLSQFNRSV